MPTIRPVNHLVGEGQIIVRGAIQHRCRCGGGAMKLTTSTPVAGGLERRGHRVGNHEH